MIQLPFHKWSLSFSNKDYEDRFEREQNELREFNFRLLSFSATIGCLMCLIVFLVQRQPLIMILSVAALIVVSFLSMLLSSRIKNYLKYVFTLQSILLVGGGVFVSLSAYQIPQFFYGFHTCILAIFILKNTDKKVKLFFVCVTPPILLKIFSLYDLETLQFIEFAICGAVILALMLYHLEYNERLCFSIKILNQKQMEIMHQVNDGFLAVSFDQRTGQFDLEFTNRASEEQFSINDTESMKQFLRNTYISDSVFNSNDTQLKRSTTTEEFLHKMINQGSLENTLKITQQNQVRNLEIKRICYGKPILFIVIKKQVNIQQEQEKDFQNIKNQLIGDLQSIGRLHKQLLKELFNRIPLYSIGIMIFNSLKNCMLLLEQDKIFELSGFVQPLFLKQLIFAFNPIFVNLSNRQSKKFFKIINVDDDFQLKLNLKFLIQILLNIFEFSLNHSKPQSTIILQITEEQSSDQNLLKFIFTFSSTSELSNPFNQETLNITNQLLGYIGPNDNIEYNQNQMNITTYDIRNEISFYIYQYQLENLTSYTKFISKRKQQ